MILMKRILTGMVFHLCELGRVSSAIQIQSRCTDKEGIGKASFQYGYAHGYASCPALKRLWSSNCRRKVFHLKRNCYFRFNVMGQYRFIPMWMCVWLQMHILSCLEKALEQ